MSDYLFDKAGETDPEIERLEGLLAPLAYRGAAPRLPRRRAPRAWLVAGALTAAAAVIVALVVAHPWRPAPPAIGEWIETADATMRLTNELGTVDLAPRTRARIVAAGPARHEMQLARGTLTATIHAPPRRFVVTTPHAVVTDLGCVFEVTVDEAGRGRVVVREGQVAVAGADGREVVVAAGAQVELSERGPVAPDVRPTVETPTPPSTAPTPPTNAPHPTAPTPHHHAAPHASKTPTRAPKKPAGASAPARPQPHAGPAHKDEGPRIEHDALKDLQHDVE